jgi:hypothetical protein
MPLFDRSSRSRIASAVLFAGAVGISSCNGENGSARVQASFFKNECGPGDPQDLANYGFDARYLVTERFKGVLLITIQKYKADLVESDGITARLQLDQLLKRGILAVDSMHQQIVRADPTKAALIKTSTGAGDANVSLSLYQTCPNFPTSNASAGLISFDKLTLAQDATNTGENEHLGGTITATLTRLNEDGPVGRLNVVFDFAPPRRPLIANQ